MYTCTHQTSLYNILNRIWCEGICHCCKHYWLLSMYNHCSKQEVSQFTVEKKSKLLLYMLLFLMTINHTHTKKKKNNHLLLEPQGNCRTLSDHLYCLHLKQVGTHQYMYDEVCLKKVLRLTFYLQRQKGGMISTMFIIVFNGVSKLRSILDCPVSWGCRIHWLHLHRGVRPFPNKCPGYDIKQSDGEVPVMLELWGNMEHPFIAITPMSTGLEW